MVLLNTKRNQLGVFDAVDINYYMQMLVDDTFREFPLLYDQSPMMALLPKRPVNNKVQEWSIKKNDHSFTAQPLDSPMLWAGYPVPPDTNNYIYSEFVTAQHIMHDELVGYIEFNNTQFVERTTVAELDNLFAFRLGEAMRVLMRDLNNLIYVGTGVSPQPIKGLVEIFSFFDETGTMSSNDADYVLSNLPHGKPADATAVEGVDYYRKWRPLCALWDSVADDLEIANGHGSGADAGGGLNASGGTAAVANTVVSNVTDLRIALDQFTLHMDKSGLSYDFIVTNPDIAQSYKTLYYQSAGIEIPNGAIAMAELGTAQVATYRGRPIISDRFCPDNVIYFIGQGALEFITLEFAQAPQGSMVGLNRPSSPLAIAVGGLSMNNLTQYRYAILTRPSLLVRNPNALSCLRLA